MAKLKKLITGVIAAATIAIISSCTTFNPKCYRGRENTLDLKVREKSETFPSTRSEFLSIGGEEYYLLPLREMGITEQYLPGIKGTNFVLGPDIPNAVLIPKKNSLEIRTFTGTTYLPNPEDPEYYFLAPYSILEAREYIISREKTPITIQIPARTDEPEVRWEEPNLVGAVKNLCTTKRFKLVSFEDPRPDETGVSNNPQEYLVFGTHKREQYFISGIPPNQEEPKIKKVETLSGILFSPFWKTLTLKRITRHPCGNVEEFYELGGYSVVPVRGDLIPRRDKECSDSRIIQLQYNKKQK